MSSTEPSADPPSAPVVAARRSVMRIYLAFFFSGAAGLIFQVVWVRSFGTVFGNTVYSAALVTAVFIGGLGLGSLVAGRVVDAGGGKGPATLVTMYAVLELAIAVWGIAVGQLLPHLTELSASTSSYVVDDASGWMVLSGGSILQRYLVAAALLGPVTAAMGATLPILIRALVAGDVGAAGLRTGLLYGLNTAGAALGCFATDLVLMPAMGASSTQLVAGACNVVAALTALSLVRALRGPRQDVAGSDTPAQATATEPSTASEGVDRTSRLVSVALFLSGVGAMGMEIVWLRTISSSVGQERSVFSILLGVMLLAMWLGALSGGLLDRRFGRPGALLAGAIALFSTSSVLLLAFIDELGGTALGFAFALATLPSLALGAIFPLANGLVQSSSAAVGRRVGALYFGNTLGNLTGSLLAGFVLIPVEGAQLAARDLSLISALALVPLLLLARGRPALLPPRVVVTLGVPVALVVTWFSQLAPHHVVMGSFRSTLPAGERVVLVREGVNELAVVTHAKNGHRKLWTNGHTMSSEQWTARRYMRALAHVPLLQMDAPESVLVICFGVGNTAQAASLHPSVTRLHVADLSENVLGLAPQFEQANRRVLEDDRVTVFVNDGRHHLLMQPPGSYDLITLEPPPITHAGMAALYSREFYELARSRLAPGGYLTQWLPTHAVKAELSLALVRAFLEVFDDGVLLVGWGQDLILMGRNAEHMTMDPEQLQRRLAEHTGDPLGADLEHLFLDSVVRIAGMIGAPASTLHDATRDVAPVTDDNAAVEYPRDASAFTTRLPPTLFAPRRVAELCPTCEAFSANADVPLRDWVAITDRVYASPRFLGEDDDFSYNVWPVSAELESRRDTIAKDPFLTLLFDWPEGLVRAASDVLPPDDRRGLSLLLRAYQIAPDSAVVSDALIGRYRYLAEQAASSGALGERDFFLERATAIEAAGRAP